MLACIRRYFLRIWACYTGRRGTCTRTRRSTWARDRLNGWYRHQQQSSSLTRKKIRRMSVTVPCTQFHVLKKRYFSSLYTCAIGSCMPSCRLPRLDAPLVITSLSVFCAGLPWSPVVSLGLPWFLVVSSGLAWSPGVSLETKGDHWRDQGTKYKNSCIFSVFCNS